MSSWQSGQAVAPLSKAAMVDALQSIGRTVARAKRAGRNTLDWTDDKGVRRIRLHQTDILTIQPRGGFTVDTGGWNTHTTRARLNEHLPKGWRVYTVKGTLHLCEINMGMTQYPFRQTVTVNARGVVKPDVTPAANGKPSNGRDKVRS